MNFYAYARVSSEQQADNTSLPDQIANSERYAREKHGVTIPRANIHVEPGRTGHDLKRPQLQAMLRRLLPGDIVIVNTVDRLSRSLDDLWEVRNLLKRIGAHCWSATEDLDVATADLNKILQLMLTGWFAEQEWDKIKGRMDGGRRSRMRQGEAAFGNTAPYGFRAVKRIVEPDKHIGTFLEASTQEAEVVALIYRLFLDEGLSSKAIALKLNALGIPSPAAGRGKNSRGWYGGRVRQILKSETYSGVYHWGEITIPVPALVSEERRALAIARLTENVRMPKNPLYQYLLTGLIRCDECHHAYTAGMHRSGDRMIGYYSCEGRNHPGAFNMAERCQAPSLRLADVESWLWGRVVALASDPARITTYLAEEEAASAPNDEAELFMLTGRIAGLEREAIGLVRMRGRGEVDEGQLREAMDANAAELTECRATYKELGEKRRDTLVRQAQAKSAAERLVGLQETLQHPDLPFELRREVVTGLVYEIGMSMDRVRVAYKLAAAPLARGGDCGREPAVPTAGRIPQSPYIILTESFALSEIAVCPA